jgi:hypothetical protein
MAESLVFIWDIFSKKNIQERQGDFEGQVLRRWW